MLFLENVSKMAIEGESFFVRRTFMKKIVANELRYVQASWKIESFHLKC